MFSFIVFNCSRYTVSMLDLARCGIKHCLQATCSVEHAVVPFFKQYSVDLYLCLVFLHIYLAVFLCLIFPFICPLKCS